MDGPGEQFYQQDRETILGPAPHPSSGGGATISFYLSGGPYLLPQQKIDGSIKIVSKHQIPGTRLVLQIVGQERCVYKQTQIGMFGTSNSRSKTINFLNKGFAIHKFTDGNVKQGLFMKDFSIDLSDEVGTHYPPSTLIIDKGCECAGVLYFVIVTLEGDLPLSSRLPIEVLPSQLQLPRPQHLHFETEEVTAACCSSPVNIYFACGLEKNAFFSDQDLQAWLEMDASKLKKYPGDVELRFYAQLTFRNQGKETKEVITLWRKKVQVAGNGGLRSNKKVFIDLRPLSLSSNDLFHAKAESPILGDIASRLQPTQTQRIFSVQYRLAVKAVGASCVSFNIQHEFSIFILHRPPYGPPDLNVRASKDSRGKLNETGDESSLEHRTTAASAMRPYGDTAHLFGRN